MSLIYSKVTNKDGDVEIHASACGKITRTPELKETTKGNKVKFSVCYGKGLYMDCEAWADGFVGEIAGHLEQGDFVDARGIIREWDYNGKHYKSLNVDGLFPMGIVSAVTSEPTKSEVANAGDWSELTEEDDSLPF